MPQAAITGPASRQACQAAAAGTRMLSADTVKAAQEAGPMLGRLVPDIRRTAKLVEEITAACREQDAGSTQIDQATGQLDKVTPQNASASEQVSATAGTLADRAGHLQSTIAFFGVDEEAAGGPTPESRPVAKLQQNAAQAFDPLSRAARTAPPRRPGAVAAGGFALDMSERANRTDDGFRRAS